MKLSDIEFVRLLPQFMRNDSAVKGLAAGVDEIIPKLTSAVSKLSTWDHIDELSEAELDELAWELNILWYDPGANIDIKRDLVKNSDKVYQKLGTKWAVESVILSYFGDGYIEEWFEYGGEPGHFRVISSNPSLSEEKLTDFLRILEHIKRASAKLDSVQIIVDAKMSLCAGVGHREAGRDVFEIGAKL